MYFILSLVSKLHLKNWWLTESQKIISLFLIPMELTYFHLLLVSNWSILINQILRLLWFYYYSYGSNHFYRWAIFWFPLDRWGNVVRNLSLRICFSRIILLLLIVRTWNLRFNWRLDTRIYLLIYQKISIKKILCFWLWYLISVCYFYRSEICFWPIGRRTELADADFN